MSEKSTACIPCIDSDHFEYGQCEISALRLNEWLGSFNGMSEDNRSL